jgi:hypothetical protein
MSVMCLALKLKLIRTRNFKKKSIIMLTKCRLHHCKWFIVLLSVFAIRQLFQLKNGLCDLEPILNI